MNSTQLQEGQQLYRELSIAHTAAKHGGWKERMDLDAARNRMSYWLLEHAGWLLDSAVPEDEA